MKGNPDQMLLRWTGDKQDEQGEPTEGVAEATASTRTPSSGGWALILGTVLWFAVALFYIDSTSGLSSLMFMFPHEQAQILIALLAPPTFAWLIALVYRKSGETARSRAALMEVLADVSGPDREAEARLNATAMSLRRISQTVESELENALARADALNAQIDTGLSRLAELSEGADLQSRRAGELLEEAGGEQRKLLEELQSLGEKTRSLSRTEGTELTAAAETASRRADEIAVLLDAKARTVSETVENASRRAGEIGAVIEQPMNRMREESEQTVRRITNASQELKSRVEALSQEMGRTADQAGQASQGVDASAVRLRQASGEMRGLLSGTGEEVKQRINELQELVSGAMRSSEQATQRMDQRLGQLAGSLDSLNISAGESEEALAASVDRVAGMAATFSEQAGLMQEAATETVERTEGAAAGVLEASTSFGVASRQIDVANRRLGEARDEVTATVTHLSGVVEETVSALEERIREVSSFAEGASERSGEKLQKVSVEIAGSARNLGRQIALIEEQARGSEAQVAGSADILGMRIGELNSVLSEIGAESEKAGEGVRRLSEDGRDLIASLTAQTASMNDAIEASAAVANRSTAGISNSVGDIHRASAETEAKLGELADALAAHAGGLDAVSNRLAASAASIESKAAARLSDVAGKVEDLVGTADASFAGWSERVEALFGDLQSRSGQMTEAVATATDRTNAAGEQLSEAMAELSLLLQEVDQSVSHAGDSFGQLDDRVREVATTIRGGVEDNLALMEDRGREVTGRLFETAQELSAASEELDRRSGLSLDRLAELRDRTAGQLESVEARLGALTELWRERTGLFEGATDGLQRAAARLDGETANRLVSFTARMSEAVTQARDTVDGLEVERNRLLQAGQETEERLGGLTAEIELRLTAAADRAVQGASSVREEVDGLEQQVVRLRSSSETAAEHASGNAERIETVLSAVQKVAGGLSTEVERLAATSVETVAVLGDSGNGIQTVAERMRDNLSASAQSIAGEGRRVADVLQQLQDELSEADAGMTGRMVGLEKSVRDAADLAQLTSDALLAGTEALIEESGRVKDEMSGASGALLRQIGEIGGAGQEAAGKIAGAASELEIRVDALKAAGGGAEAEVAARAEDVARRMQELTEVSRASSEAWEAGAQSIELAARTSEAHSKSALASLQEATGALDETLPRIGGLEVSAEGLRDHGRRLAQAVADMESASTETLKRVSEQREGLSADNSRIAAEMSAGLERLSEGIEEARARMSVFATAEKTVLETVEETTGRVDNQLEQSRQIAIMMGERGAELDSKLAARIEAVEKAERSASEAAELLAESLGREQERLSGMRDLALTDAELFAGSIASTLDDLRTRSGEFSTHVESLNEAAEQLRSDLSVSVEKIAEDATAAAEAGGRISEAAERSNRKLAEQREAFALSAEDADRAAERARKMLAEQATAIASASQAATVQAGLAARSFEGQATRLEEAARRAAESAVLLDDTSRDSRDRRFLNSAAEVAGGLNSLALDLHRLLDAEATETNWQRYLSGDRGLFTRRLLNRSTRKQIAGAYHSDGDFRRHVDQYMVEFEGVLSAAVGADHEGLLTGIFMSADVGKLYLVLCDALDRDPVTPPKRKNI